MIDVLITSEEARRTWENLSNPDWEFIHSDDFKSLLEIAVEAAADQTVDEGARLIRQRLCELFRQLRYAMANFWSDHSVQSMTIRMKDITHNRRILYYLDRILFPRTSEHIAEGRARLLYKELDFYAIYSLLCAVYLHDYGKGQYLLLIPQLPEKHPILGGREQTEKTLKNTRTFSDLDPDYLKILEEYHSHTISIFINYFINASTASDLKKALKNAYPHPMLDDYIGEIGTSSGPSCTLNPHPSLNNASGDAAQRWLFWILWRIKELGPLGPPTSLQMSRVFGYFEI